jgi:hypothetical protein
LPFKGKQPNLFLPTTSIPAIAKDLAESPSVRIKVQCSENFVPASIASSSFGMLILSFLEPVSCLENYVSSLWFADSIIYGIIEEATIRDWNFFVSVQVEPKF